jgi:hypothetical protein
VAYILYTVVGQGQLHNYITLFRLSLSRQASYQCAQQAGSAGLLRHSVLTGGSWRHNSGLAPNPDVVEVGQEVHVVDVRLVLGDVGHSIRH